MVIPKRNRNKAGPKQYKTADASRRLDGRAKFIKQFRAIMIRLAKFRNRTDNLSNALWAGYMADSLHKVLSEAEGYFQPPREGDYFGPPPITRGLTSVPIPDMVKPTREN